MARDNPERWPEQPGDFPSRAQDSARSHVRERAGLAQARLFGREFDRGAAVRLALINCLTANYRSSGLKMWARRLAASGVASWAQGCSRAFAGRPAWSAGCSARFARQVLRGARSLRARAQRPADYCRSAQSSLRSKMKAARSASACCQTEQESQAQSSLSHRAVEQNPARKIEALLLKR
jgi:hypothetical protein